MPSRLDALQNSPTFGHLGVATAAHSLALGRRTLVTLCPLRRRVGAPLAITRRPCSHSTRSARRGSDGPGCHGPRGSSVHSSCAVFHFIPGSRASAPKHVLMRTVLAGLSRARPKASVGRSPTRFRRSPPLSIVKRARASYRRPAGASRSARPRRSVAGGDLARRHERTARGRHVHVSALRDEALSDPRGFGARGGGSECPAYSSSTTTPPSRAC